jgi:cytochrome P450
LWLPAAQRKLCQRKEKRETDMLDRTSMVRPPAPVPRLKRFGPLELLAVLLDNPLEAWTEAHFNEPVVMGGLPFIRVAVVSDPDAIRRVLVDNSDNYKKDWLQRRILSAGLSNGLLTAESGQWRLQRRMLAPLFSPKAIRRFSAAMFDAAQALVARLNRHHGEVIDLAVEVTRVSLDTLERTIFSDGFGGNSEEIRESMKSYFEAIGRIDPFDVFGAPPSMPRLGRLKARPALRIFDRAIDSIISARRRRIAHDPDGVPEDLLSLLLRAEDTHTGARLTEAEVRSNVLTFIAAGHETTANCLTWALFLLSQSSECRERVRWEADRNLDGDIDGLADRLANTRAVIDEANRLYPPITAISRAAVEPDELAGHTIRGRTLIVISPYVLHRHRLLWSNPDCFDPTRFLDGERDTIQRFAYLPFGAGPRVCIGSTFALREAAIVLAVVVRHFKLELLPDHKVWPVQRVSLRPKNGLPMVVRPW